MFERIKSVMVYHGLDAKSYSHVKTKIDNANRTMVSAFSGIGLILTTIMLVLTFIIEESAPNRTVYIGGVIGSVLLFISSFVVSKKYGWLVTILVHISFAVFFLYGIFIGTVTNPTQQTVTFMVMITFMPVLFIDKPFRVGISISAYVALFVIRCFATKTGSVLTTDVTDSIIYGALGITSSTIINHIKVRSYLLEHKLQEISRFDQMTQMNNRNSFELDLDNLPDICDSSLTCVYIDVNGLHELNNSKGHAKGDIMLKYVAAQVKRFLSENYSYRIGGDEFVSFIPDIYDHELHQRIEELKKTVEQEGYHIAVGVNTLNKYRLRMDTLVGTAESHMYRDKKQYYKDTIHDRRQRES